MRPPLAQLEQQKRDLLAAFSRLGDLRPGSISAFARRCGKPNCHCAQPDHPGHGPQQRLTFKRQGKTVIGSRLKRSGMFWTVRGANAILALRCCRLNGSFEEFWADRRPAA